MALVKEMYRITLHADNVHDVAPCTYAVFPDETGRRYLQIDTYDSPEAQQAGTPGQSILFGAEAARQLSRVLAVHFPNLRDRRPI